MREASYITQTLKPSWDLLFSPPFLWACIFAGFEGPMGLLFDGEAEMYSIMDRP